MKGLIQTCILWPVRAVLLIAFLIFVPFGRGTPVVDAADAFYDGATVQTIYLEIQAVDLERLQQALPRRISVPGTFRWNNQSIENVGIRYKGNSSASPTARYKRSYLVEFSEFVQGQRFLGLRHVALDNAIQFGSLFSERMITDILRDLKVAASRCNYARVFLNGKFAGVFVNVERIDRPFLKRNFNSETGVLFKVDDGGPGADLRYIGDDPALYQKTFELHLGKKADAFNELVGLLRRVNDPATTETQLRESLDIESFITTTAVLLFAGAFDQYTGWSPHNYYLYQSRADRRWTYIPWDLDVGFADQAFGRIPVLHGWNAAWPAPVPGRPLMDRIIEDKHLLGIYREKAKSILDAHFRPDVLIPKLRFLYAQIETDLKHEPFPPRRVTVPSDTGYEDILRSIEAFIRERYKLARAQLDAPGNRPQPQNPKPDSEQENPRPGPPSTDAPTDLRVVKAAASGVELKWVNHADHEMAVVVQRCSGETATDFVNAIGQPGQNITTAIDHNIQAGHTYRYRVYAVLPAPKGMRGTGVSNIVTVRVPAI
jgi:hypothetical protein